MKKLLFTLTILASFSVFSQSPSKIFTTDTLVYYGIDFSNCRLIGDFGNGGGMDMKTKMFVSWNDIFIKEQGKYDLHKTFRKQVVYYDMNPVASQNANTDENQILTYKTEYKLDPALIPSIVANYEKGEQTEGLGLVFIVDSYDKNRVQARVYVTFFDIATKQVLLSELLTGIPGGISLRNYWSRAMYEILEKIQHSYYLTWKKKYSPKK